MSEHVSQTSSYFLMPLFVKENRHLGRSKKVNHVSKHKAHLPTMKRAEKVKEE
jgi:hypothetical protein